MSKAIPFESLVVGAELGPVEHDVSGPTVADYSRDWEDPNPIYVDGSPDFDEPIAPPAFMAGLTGFRLLGTKYDTSATIGAQTEHENLGPLKVGQKMTTVGRIADKYIKRGLEYVVIESTSYDGAGKAFRRSRDHLLLSLERIPDEQQGGRGQ